MSITLPGLLEVFSHLPHATAVYDREDLNIAFVNKAMLAIWERTDNLVGRTLGEVFPEYVSQGFEGILRKVWLTGETYAAQEVPANIMIEGVLTPRFFDFEYRAIHDETGKTTAILHTAVEVSDRMQAWKVLSEKEVSEAAFNEELNASNEELLQTNKLLNVSLQNTQELNESLRLAYAQILESEDRLNLAIQSANIGAWRLDVSNSDVRWDARTRELYGFTEGEVVAYDDVLRYTHPSDRSLVDEAVNKALDPELRAEYDVKFRTVDQTGKLLKWIHAKGKAYFDTKNLPAFFSGIVLDITETMLAQDRTEAFHKLIQQKERKLQLIVDSAKVGTYTFNLKTREIQLNDHSRKLFGFPENELLTEDSPIEQTLGEYIPMAIAAMEMAIQENKPYDYSYQIRDRRSGAVKWLRSVGNAAGVSSPDMFYGVIIDITAQKNEEQRKTDFLGIASHELRSPLTALTGYLQILEYKASFMSPERMVSIVHKAEKQTARMRNLIDGFLNISNIEDKTLSLRLEHIDLTSILKDVETTFRDTVFSHQFFFDRPKTPLSMYADRNKIEQVIVNFMNNAVKYTPAGTRVTVSVVYTEKAITVRVTDEGSGISADEQVKLFDKYYRVDKQANQNISGFGIGLYISKEIVQLHGGNIGVDSASGEGASFWFTIPTSLNSNITI